MSNENQILPVLDMGVLREKATEFAMKGAIESIREYYTGYNSPFKKQIDEQLKKNVLSGVIELPDIIALLNESLSKELDLIVNTAISKTFVPMVQRYLVKEEKYLLFSKILKEFIKATESENEDDCDVSITESVHGWLDVDLSTKDFCYSLCLHEDYMSKREGIKRYKLLSLPRDKQKKGSFSQTMTLRVEGGSLEMPFVKDVLFDEFNAYIARVVLGNCLIEMDCQDFNEEMFEGE